MKNVDSNGKDQTSMTRNLSKNIDFMTNNGKTNAFFYRNSKANCTLDKLRCLVFPRPIRRFIADKMKIFSYFSD